MNDVVYIIQNATIEQLKTEIDKVSFTYKNLKDISEG